MKVFLLQDIPQVGMAGEIITVADGYAMNFLFPRKYAVEVTPHNEKGLLAKQRVVEHRKEVVVSKTSMLAEKIKGLKAVLKAKVHDGGRLYGAVSAQDVVTLLAHEGIKVSKNQVLFDKSIKAKGLHSVVIKLSNSLQPSLSLKVVAE
jgi:large subunit ribosomal protein L9